MVFNSAPQHETNLITLNYIFTLSADCRVQLKCTVIFVDKLLLFSLSSFPLLNDSLQSVRSLCEIDGCVGRVSEGECKKVFLLHILACALGKECFAQKTFSLSRT
jgi:hypothetical protein